MKSVLVFLLNLSFISLCYSKNNSYYEPRISTKYSNPNFMKDRHKDEITKPEMPDAWVQRLTQPYTPAYMDYCDPYHCNDYNKIACGLNRRNMKFKWFQSGCHIILNNKCAAFRGNLKYDIVSTKLCMVYVMFLRHGCPQQCETDFDPVCAISNENQPVIFINNCVYDRANCNGISKFEAVDMAICEYRASQGEFTLKNE